MPNLITYAHKRWTVVALVAGAALVLLAVALMLAQPTWADHVRPSADPIGPGLTDPALLAAYPEVLTYRRNVKAYLRYFAPQDCSDLAAGQEAMASRRSVSTSPGLTDPALLAAYPEVLTYRRNVEAYLRYFARQDCSNLATDLELVVSRRSVSTSPGLTDPALLAAYPEVLTYRRNVEAYLRYFAQQDCSNLDADQEAMASRRSVSTSPGLTDPALLAAYPEVLTYRRSVDAYLRYFAQMDCSELGS